ncbi:SDR family oxidoreductase [Pseudomonas syringae group genomosp. 7]|uniref:SDR family oxidoreductase n=1 Tax=Pseudomonas syringae group genomosp. 7 TaxID=251699 RepID=UPI002D78E493|nr:SDR family oxidoreductase [Pseudomonas syringae group genomosp. 7]
MAFDLSKENIRVNVLSAPPFPSSSAIGHTAYSGLSDTYAKKLQPAVTPSVNEILNVAIFLISDNSIGVTGDRIFVDGGVPQYVCSDIVNIETLLIQNGGLQFRYTFRKAIAVSF